MKRYYLMVAFATIAIGLMAGAIHQVRAETTPGNEQCYHHLYNCSDLDDNGYWSGCDPSAPDGVIGVEAAKTACSAYHSS